MADFKEWLRIGAGVPGGKRYAVVGVQLLGVKIGSSRHLRVGRFNHTPGVSGIALVPRGWLSPCAEWAVPPFSASPP